MTEASGRVAGNGRRRVLILGHGEIGRAMEYLLAARHELMIWQRRAPIDLEAAAGRAEVVLFCVPASPHEELARRIAPQLAAGTVCLTVAKGLDEAGRPAVEALGEAFAGGGAQPAVSHGALHGPMIAEEILRGRPAFAACASERPAVFETARRLFEGSPLALAYTPDVIGAAWCAVLKNIYAMLFGAADGLGLGDNLRGYLAVAVLEEMGEIVSRLGGRPATAASLAGLGDLLTTATAAGSHHHALGMRIARGERELAGEGVHAIEMLARHRGRLLAEHPLLALVTRLLAEPGAARRLIEAQLAAWRAARALERIAS